jgi:hypothetical protein
MSSCLSTFEPDERLDELDPVHPPMRIIFRLTNSSVA